MFYRSFHCRTDYIGYVSWLGWCTRDAPPRLSSLSLSLSISAAPLLHLLIPLRVLHLRLELLRLALVVLPLEHVAPLLNDPIDQTVLDRLLRREVPPAIEVSRHLLLGFPAKLRHESHVRVLAHVDLVRSDLHVHRGVERPVQLRRVRHDLRVGQRVPAPRMPRREEHRGVPEAFPDGDGVHLRLDVPHGVKDGVRLGVDADHLALLVDAPAAVDVHVPRSLVLFVVEEQKLRDDELCDRREEGHADVDDSRVQ
eukprot:31018-Pelagococcus_subviridis.AAC.15